MESGFRSEEYRRKWPSDSLHTWSRVWEYPYVFGNLLHLKEARDIPEGAVIADVGSGVTFFPFALARAGFNVWCVDRDPICKLDLEKAVEVMAASPGTVSCLTSGPDSIPISDQSVHAIVCVSVLEHVDDPAALIEEFARILLPNGVCLLTLDLDLKGNLEIGPERYSHIVRTLMDKFILLYPEVTVHPASLLRTDTGPYPMAQPSRMSILRYTVQENLVKPALGMISRPVPIRPILAVQGSALRKR